MNNDARSDAEPANNAVSVYGQNDAMDDFPVLKAFQQYVDAEQAKAQKRTTMLCIFFAVIMAIVVGVFVLLLLSISHRNDTLNDQVFQLLLKGRDSQMPLVIQQPQLANPSNDGAVKALSDAMAALQLQLAEQQSKAYAATSRAAKTDSGVEQSPSRDQFVQERQNRAEAENLRRIRELLDSQRKELAAEKERLHQKEIELQRRKLYPELYDADGNMTTPKKRSAPPPVAVRYFDVDDYEEGAAPRKTASGALRYFDAEEDTEEEDEVPETPASSPSAPNRTSSGWEIPLD